MSSFWKNNIKDLIAGFPYSGKGKHKKYRLIIYEPVVYMDATALVTGPLQYINLLFPAYYIYTYIGNNRLLSGHLKGSH